MSNNVRELTQFEAEKFLNVGFNNFITTKRIIAILEPGSLPMKRLREKTLELNHLVDVTHGRKLRSVIVTDSNHLILSALGTVTLQERLYDKTHRLNPAQLEIEGGQFAT